MLTLRQTADRQGDAHYKEIYLIGEQREKDIAHTTGSPKGLPSALEGFLTFLVLPGVIFWLMLWVRAIVALCHTHYMDATWFCLGGAGSLAAPIGLILVTLQIERKIAGDDLFDNRAVCVQKANHVSYRILFIDPSNREGWPTADQMKEIMDALRSDSELGRDLKPLYDMYFTDSNVMDAERQLSEHKDTLDKEMGAKLYEVIRDYAHITHTQALVTLRSHKDCKAAEQQASIARVHAGAQSLLDRAAADLQGRRKSQLTV